MKKKVFLIIILLFNLINITAQSLNPTSHISVQGEIDSFKGGYTFSYATSGSPWNGALISFGGFQYNNYDCQISTDYGPNGGNHISFRTKNGDLNTWNPWSELATRGPNYFNGDQVINGAISSSMSDATGGHISLQNPSKTTNGTASNWRIYNMTGPYGNSLQFWAYDNLNCETAGALCNNRFTIMDNGNIGIGTGNPTSKLTVAGNIASREVKVTVDAGADFVFDNKYNLPSLESVDKFIKENKHLPEIASAKEMQKDGINLSEMNIKLLQKIEEMTLYMIEMKKENEAIKNENREIKKDIAILKTYKQ